MTLHSFFQHYHQAGRDFNYLCTYKYLTVLYVRNFVIQFACSALMPCDFAVNILSRLQPITENLHACTSSFAIFLIKLSPFHQFLLLVNE